MLDRRIRLRHVQAFAESLGLPGVPRVRFLNKVKGAKDKGTVQEEESEDEPEKVSLIPSAFLMVKKSV